MDDNSSKSSSRKRDRKTIEKNRRNQMKTLYSQLNSIIVPQSSSSSKGPMSLADQIDEATNYIKRLQEDVQNLKRTKESLSGSDGIHANNDSNSSSSGTEYLNSLVQVEVNTKDDAIEVILVTGLDCQFIFTEAIRILHEEHAEVVNASYSVDETKVFHNIHAKVGDQEVNFARINERLKQFSLD